MRESGEGRGREDLIRQDVLDLHRLGYAQQLFREMGGFSNFAISFSIISVLTGAVLLFGYGLKLAGPIVNSVGWPVVSLFTLAVAASMAELASAYPTAGGLYFWAHRLGGRGWGWVTAWLNMLGQVTITAGIDVAAAIYLVGAVCRPHLRIGAAIGPVVLARDRRSQKGIAAPKRAKGVAIDRPPVDSAAGLRLQGRDLARREIGVAAAGGEEECHGLVHRRHAYATDPSRATPVSLRPSSRVVSRRRSGTLEGRAIPLAEVRRRLVRALQEREEHLVG